MFVLNVKVLLVCENQNKNTCTRFIVIKALVTVHKFLTIWGSDFNICKLKACSLWNLQAVRYIF